MRYKAEYIWIDGTRPTAKLRVNIDITDLVYPDHRQDVASYLDAHGWKAQATSVAELFTANGLPPLGDGEDDALFGSLVYVSATRK